MDKNLRKRSFNNKIAKPYVIMSVMSLAGFAQSISAETPEGDLLTLQAGAEEVWDSNFSQTPDENSEHYTHSSVGLNLYKALRSNEHKFRAGWVIHQLDYAEREDLDSDYSQGGFSWDAQWIRWLHTDVSWQRESYPVEQQEFEYKDIVQLDEAEGKFTIGKETGFAVAVGGRDAAQTHSADARSRLEFDETETYGELIYKFHTKTSVLVRFRDGERNYLEDYVLVENVPIENAPLVYDNLDYTYQTAEFEMELAGNGRTKLKSTVGYFDREGDVNDGTGGLASLDGYLELSEKTLLHAGYTYREPVVGEESDSPVKENILSAGLDWDISSKFSFHSSMQVNAQDYERLRDGPARDETLYRITPFQLSYQPWEPLSLRLTTEWKERESPLDYREYATTVATLGVFLRY